LRASYATTPTLVSLLVSACKKVTQSKRVSIAADSFIITKS